MKKKISTIVKKVWITGLALLMILSIKAQKDRGVLVIPRITQSQIDQITEIVKPVKDQVENLLKADKTGTYKAYLEEIKNWNASLNGREKNISAAKLIEKYSTFLKGIWGAAQVDEASYQQRIKNVFPDVISKNIQFQSFLSFTVDVSQVANSILGGTDPTAPKKCVDICGMIAGEINGSSSIISGGGGTYGNCYLSTKAWSAVFGLNDINGYLRNTVSIPGTFAADNRKLHVKKSFELRQEATAFAGIGFSFAETRLTTYKSREYLLAMATVVGGCNKLKFKTINEDYLLEKKDVGYSIFHSDGSSIGLFVSGAWSYTDCIGIKWSMCEE